MRTHVFLSAILLLVPAALLAQKNTIPDLNGYVTHATSPSEFDVNGVHIRIDGKTKFFAKAKHDTHIAAPDVKPYIGQPMQVWGNLRNNDHSLQATQITLVQPKSPKVEGHGLIHSVQETSTPGEHLLRADGYPVLITAKTQAGFAPPLTADTAFHTNVWISFHGHQRPDGVVVAEKAGFVANVVNDSEDKLRAKSEYDPHAVDPNSKQSNISKAFRGIDPKQIPPYHDDAMQERIDRIGASLVPQYQRDLPANDPTKIDFRFYLVDEKHLHSSVEPGGIIVVPYQAVQRMENDSQLAGLLAIDVAIALEKQSFRIRPTMHGMSSAFWLGQVGGAFVPGLGVATMVGTEVGESKLMRHVTEQSGRVGLGLMHDAGYDLTQAPLAYWRLTDRDSKGLDQTPIPPNVQYLYRFLGETWHGQ